MTIITKAIGEKKGSEKMEQPLFVQETTVVSTFILTFDSGIVRTSTFYFN